MLIVLARPFSGKGCHLLVSCRNMTRLEAGVDCLALGRKLSAVRRGGTLVRNGKKCNTNEFTRNRALLFGFWILDQEFPVIREGNCNTTSIWGAVAVL
jgi:hypothetical protein